MEADIPWLVVPTYNEAENLEALVQAATKALRKASPEGFAMLIVDDNSPDGTGRLADRLAAEREELRVLHRPGKGGLGPAYLAGFTEALAGGAGYVMEMDADFSHDPDDIGRLLAAARDGADLVLGSRYVPGGGVTDWGVVRQLISRSGSVYARVILGMHEHDLTGGTMTSTGGTSGLGGATATGGSTGTVDAGVDRGACICPDVIAPVCGANGITYGNACLAGCASVTVAHTGACVDGGVIACTAVRGCCSTDDDCNGNQECAGMTCGSDGRASGVCKARPARVTNRCWTDADCAGNNNNTTCAGAIICPCGSACLRPDMAGTCN